MKTAHNITAKIHFNEILTQEDEQKLLEALRIILDIKQKQIAKGA